MPISPIEQLNTFDPDVIRELYERRKNTNINGTRMPFLRFTTGASIGELASGQYIPYLDAKQYVGCKYFTLGIQGWDNLSYSTSDIYGAQNGSGVIAGITYSNGSQKIVRTKYIDGGSVESVRGYPPPGITSARVERLRNGNVLKFTIEAECFTQQQLDLLDIAAFVPGMTCILEWGSVQATASGVSKLVKTLDFANMPVFEIANLLKQSRSTIVEQWCKPNKYNYDFAIANVANVKTVMQDGIYKITVTAYGLGDNIMYISAYHTTNPIDIGDTDALLQNTYPKTAREYFSPNFGEFKRQLEREVEKKNPKILKIANPVNVQDATTQNSAGSTGKINDIGFEDTYFISFDYFISDIINGRLLEIIKNSAEPKDVISTLVRPIRVTPSISDDVYSDTDIKVSWNRYLRSTDPSIMLILNKSAIDASQSNPSETILVDNIKGTVDTKSEDYKIFTSLKANELNTASQQSILNKNYMIPNAADADYATSGAVSLAKGVMLNSKTIQEVFLGARTIIEALELILQKMNAATEGYWDLKIIWDEEVEPPAFRILDDHLRQRTDTQSDIYMFNKKFSNFRNADNSVSGPEVINISVETDYPKMLFSQLAISSINNTVSTPERADFNFRRGAGAGYRRRGLPDAFKISPIAPTIIYETPETVQLPQTNQVVVSLKYPDLFKALGNSNMPRSMQSILSVLINAVGSDKTYRLLTKGEINVILSYLSKDDMKNLTTTVKTEFQKVLFGRLKEIITKSKESEKTAFQNTAIKSQTYPLAQSKKGAQAGIEYELTPTSDKVKNNIDASKNKLISLAESAKVKISTKQ